MNTRLGGEKETPSASLCDGRSKPPSRYSNVLFPEPLAPTIDTYSPRSMDTDTPRRIWLAVSPDPRNRCTFCARMIGASDVIGPVGKTAPATAVIARL